MPLKPPSIKNLQKRKKFFQENIGYPNAIKELRKIFAIEVGKLWDAAHECRITKKEYAQKKQVLIKEGQKACEAFEDIKQESEVQKI